MVLCSFVVVVVFVLLLVEALVFGVLGVVLFVFWFDGCVVVCLCGDLVWWFGFEFGWAWRLGFNGCLDLRSSLLWIGLAVVVVVVSLLVDWLLLAWLNCVLYSSVLCGLLLLLLCVFACWLFGLFGSWLQVFVWYCLLLVL